MWRLFIRLTALPRYTSSCWLGVDNQSFIQPSSRMREEMKERKEGTNDGRTNKIIYIYISAHLSVHVPLFDWSLTITNKSNHPSVTDSIFFCFWILDRTAFTCLTRLKHYRPVSTYIRSTNVGKTTFMMCSFIENNFVHLLNHTGVSALPESSLWGPTMTIMILLKVSFPPRDRLVPL